jgi:hypothetical protein
MILTAVKLTEAFRSHATIGLGCGLLLATAGCAQAPPRVALPDYDPAAIAKGVLAEFDKNQDGQLSGAEVQDLRMLMRHDSSNDAALSSDEIRAVAQRWIDDRVGRCELSSRVTLDGRPLTGATVTYLPLPALGEVVPAGTGTTGENGIAIIAASVDGAPARSGMPCGMYRVKITPAGTTKIFDHHQVFEVSAQDTNIHVIAIASSLARSR